MASPSTTHVGAGPVSAPPAPTPPAAPMPPAPTPPAAPAPARPLQAVLHLRKTGPTHALVGDFITFQLVVANTGTADALTWNWTIRCRKVWSYGAGTEQAPKGNRGNWKIGRLAAAATVVREYDVLVKKPGDQENVAQVLAAGGLRETASWKVHVDEPKLNVTVSGPAKGLLNRPVKYQITVTNSGTAALTNVEVRAEMPPGAQLAEPPSNNGRVDGRQVRWLLGEAPPEKSAILTVELTSAREGEAAVHVTARADRGVSGQAEAKTRFEGVAGLHVEIDKAPDPVEVRASRFLHRPHLQSRVRARPQPATDGDHAAANAAGNAERPQRADAGRTKADVSGAGRPGGGQGYDLHPPAAPLQAGAVKVVVELQSAELAAPLHEEETTTIFGEAAPAAPEPPAPPSPPAAPPLTPPGPAAAGPARSRRALIFFPWSGYDARSRRPCGVSGLSFFPCLV